MMWRSGEVISLGERWNGCVECRVRLDGGGQARALAYTRIVGTPDVGARAILSASAAARGLGTGGYLMVVALPDRLPADPAPAPGHIVKARYTPLQYMTMGADEQESPWHDLLRHADSIEGMPVVVADLHSALPAVAAAIRARRPDARIAYVMDDGGSLPAWFSRTCARLREEGSILGTVTAGQAFGGELEAVNVHSALLAARPSGHAGNPAPAARAGERRVGLVSETADVAVVSQGPGNLGTGTRWGFSGTRAGENLNAAAALEGRPIGLLRMSSADARGRHRGLSHHTATALTRVALVETLCPCPVFDGSELSGLVGEDVRALLTTQLDSLFECGRLRRVDVSVEGLDEALASSPVPLSTMGRGLAEDPLAFLAAGVYAAADAL